MSQLGFREQFQHGCGQQVCGRMPKYLEHLGIALGENSQVGVFLQRPGKVN